MMLEEAVQSTGLSAVEVEVEVDRAHKLALIQCFFDVVSQLATDRIAFGH